MSRGRAPVPGPAAALECIQLVNGHGDSVRLLNLGARVCGIRLQTRHGAREVVLGYGNAQDYSGDRWYMGCVAGRYCNRIGGAQFAIDGRTYPLPANEGRNLLHGGSEGFHRQFWTGRQLGPDRAEYHLLSPDGDQGFPGELAASVGYHWNDDRELRVHFEAVTDRPTHVSLTSHMYFNLAGRSHEGGQTIAGHRLQVNSTAYTPVDNEQIPTGEIRRCRGTALDFAAARALGPADMSLDANLLLKPGGSWAARLWSATGDLALELATTCPALQLYTGGRLGAPFGANAGLCLEPQAYPDAPNRPGFPTTLLRPGERYIARSSYRFSEP
jgi:aldose 1-epimerase